MVRLFCTICNKTKRFRKWPNKIDPNTKGLLDPSKRLGKCDSHSVNSRSGYNRLRNVKSINIFKKPVKVVIDTSSRRKRAS